MRVLKYLFFPFLIFKNDFGIRQNIYLFVFMAFILCLLTNLKITFHKNIYKVKFKLLFKIKGIQVKFIKNTKNGKSRKRN